MPQKGRRKGDLRRPFFSFPLSRHLQIEEKQISPIISSQSLDK